VIVTYCYTDVTPKGRTTCAGRTTAADVRCSWPRNFVRGVALRVICRERSATPSSIKQSLEAAAFVPAAYERERCDSRRSTTRNKFARDRRGNRCPAYSLRYAQSAMRRARTGALSPIALPMRFVSHDIKVLLAAVFVSCVFAAACPAAAQPPETPAEETLSLADHAAVSPKGLERIRAGMATPLDISPTVLSVILWDEAKLPAPPVRNTVSDVRVFGELKTFQK